MMKQLIQRCLIFALLCSASLHVTAADQRPLLHPLFSDHAVLQRGCAVPVWGWADPGTILTVKFAGQSKQATAAADEKWTCSLDPLEASFESRALTVESTPPGARAEARDLLVGDVWLCSGQSNMEMGITLCREDEEIAKADHPNLRLLTVPHHIAYAPQETFTGSWKPCSPETIQQGGWGGFSAAAYFFGKELQKELKVPIGLIHSSWGGTVIEAWTSGPALKPFSEFQAQLKEVHDIAGSASETPLIDATNGWFLEHDPGTANHWEKETKDASAWRQATLPNNWANCGIPGGFEGVVWVQRQIDLPADWADKPLVIQLGTISDTDTTWTNGKEIGRTDSFEIPTRYTVPAGIAKSGRNVITLRITNAGGGGFQADGPPMFIHPQD
jgi:sialate O-acetylesterase